MPTDSQIVDIGGKSVLEAGRRTNHSPEINLVGEIVIDQD